MKYAIPLIAALSCISIPSFAAPAENSQITSPGKPLWYGIVGSGPNPSQPIAQIGPFQDKAACEAALALADKRNIIESGVCVPDRSEPPAQVQRAE